MRSYKNFHYFCSELNEQLAFMNDNTFDRNKAKTALKEAIEIRRIWIQALLGEVSKAELDAKGIHFIAVSE